MSFYFRKSLRAGPFRFNMSKSGVGISTGIPGFRLSSSPRGNFIHIGRGGLYYRSSIPDPLSLNAKSLVKPQSQPISSISSPIMMKDIDSADVQQLQDSSSIDLLNEINAKHKKIAFAPFVIIISILVMYGIDSLFPPAWVYLITYPLLAAFSYFVFLQDKMRKTVVLYYELESEIEMAFQLLHDSFKELLASKKAWHIHAKGQVTDINEQKRRSGAKSIVQRNVNHLKLQAPSYISTNVAIPAIPVGKQTLFFFPDRVLVYENQSVGAISYADLEIQRKSQRFIESEPVPSDSEIVDHVWQYVNKSGGPDKRFKNNRQLPVVLYSELYLKSSTGLNELLQFSNSTVGNKFVDACRNLAITQNIPANPFQPKENSV